MTKNFFNNEKAKFVDCFVLPNSGLRSFYESVEEGQPYIYHTPWIKMPDYEFEMNVKVQNHKVLKQFNKIMSEWMPHLEQLSTSWPTLLEFEKDLAAKNRADVSYETTRRQAN